MQLRKNDIYAMQLRENDIYAMQLWAKIVASLLVFISISYPSLSTIHFFFCLANLAIYIFSLTNFFSFNTCPFSYFIIQSWYTYFGQIKHFLNSQLIQSSPLKLNKER